MLGVPQQAIPDCTPGGPIDSLLADLAGAPLGMILAAFVVGALITSFMASAAAKYALKRWPRRSKSGRVIGDSAPAWWELALPGATLAIGALAGLAAGLAGGHPGDGIVAGAVGSSVPWLPALFIRVVTKKVDHLAEPGPRRTMTTGTYTELAHLADTIDEGR